MKRPTPLPGIKVRSFAHRAMKAFGFVNLNRMFEPRGPESVMPMAAPERPAEHHEGRISPQPLLRVLRQSLPDPRLISPEDWDAMFRAIQVRLVAAVGDRSDSARPPAEDDKAGHVQVVVLECVTAMAQLHAALKLQRA
jgi:hypothetical protein